jgi:hypothetical protein
VDEKSEWRPISVQETILDSLGFESTGMLFLTRSKAVDFAGATLLAKKTPKTTFNDPIGCPSMPRGTINAAF